MCCQPARLSVDFISPVICHDVPSDGCTMGRDQLCPKFPGEVQLLVRINLHLLFSSCWPGRVWKQAVDLFSPLFSPFLCTIWLCLCALLRESCKQLLSRWWCQCQRMSSVLVKQGVWAWFWRNGIVSKCHFQSLKYFHLKTAESNFTNRGWLGEPFLC